MIKKKWFLLFLLFLLPFHSMGQTLGESSLKIGIEADYGFSGKSHAFTFGPALIWEAGESTAISWIISPSAGFVKNPRDGYRPTTGLSFLAGRIPGFMFGISSQQYYNMITKTGGLAHDVRLSAEVFVALFGVMGYRYQHPLSREKEALHISRHAFVVKFPIPLKKIH